jgi:tetratricopeptide (TPR) repeat protein
MQRPTSRAAVILFLSVGLAGCAGEPGLPDVPEGAEAVSLLGTPLERPSLSPQRYAELNQDWLDARHRLLNEPASEDAAIWVGRRLAYLGRYREAITAFSDGIERHPRSAALLRHRGHRYLTVRRYALAERDLARAVRLTRGTPDAVEPDGVPNERGIPRSTLQTNIWYHLGLARYLRRDWPGAADAFRECVRLSPNDDMTVAASHWLWCSLRRAGREADAARVLDPIRPEMDVIENTSYHRLLLLYKGFLEAREIMPDVERASATDSAIAYGVGHWYLTTGDADRARRAFEWAVRTGAWPSFGVIAAEAELASPASR